LEVVEKALAALFEPCECYGRDRGVHGRLCDDARAALALVRKMRADAVVGWVDGGSLGMTIVEAVTNDMAADGHVLVYQSGGEDMGPVLLLLPDSTEDDDGE
jgi:hypothetical protein